MAGCFQIVQHLGFVFRGNHLDGFQFYNDLTKTDEVWLIRLQKRLLLVAEVQFWLSDDGYFPRGELLRQTLLINGLQKPTPHLPIHIKDRPVN